MLFLVFPQVSCCQSKLSMSCPCSSSSRRADGAGGYKHRATLCGPHQSILPRQSPACVPGWDVGLEALLTTAPSEMRGAQPQAGCLGSAQSTALAFSSVCMADVAFIYLGQSQTFPRNAWKYCWLKHREEYVQTWLACDALTCSFFLLGPTCASFLEDCSLMGEMMAKGPAVRSMEWLSG